MFVSSTTQAAAHFRLGAKCSQGGKVSSEFHDKSQTREAAQITLRSRVANLRILLWAGPTRRAERRGQACGARRNGLLPVESTKTWAGWEVEKYKRER
ncbi:hypothetical protein NN561_004661 [Cricetulus griseus]